VPAGLSRRFAVHAKDRYQDRRNKRGSRNNVRKQGICCPDARRDEREGERIAARREALIKKRSEVQVLPGHPGQPVLAVRSRALQPYDP
jgi:hypothetical protein